MARICHPYRFVGRLWSIGLVNIILAIYLASGVIGGLIIYFHPNTVAIGASGPIYGIFAAMGGLYLSIDII